MIILIGGNKGGSGKSGTATNTAVALSGRGKTCLFNADKQRSSAKWHAERVAAGLNDIELVEGFGNIAEKLVELDKVFEFVVVDVAGRNSREFITAGVVAHIIVSPLQSSQDDLDTLDELEQQIHEMRSVNPDVKVYVLQTMATTNPVIRGAERADFLGFLEDYPSLPAAKSVICHRKVYRDCRSAGIGILESNNAVAKKEFNEYIKEVFGNGKA
ncbi:chromosome partitioning protein ParA [Citrobacter portucalensis]|uniref:division plane positioning ATPase MipZ n=1 Tax=Citrobacter portucalensis TaxID=1639133 RepID=UPI00226BB73F|nr:division plane positioning ATPase MipZ [Citrobacter portucalensis]MCX9019052.1 chromosome partitioning protein ParA [Citrobacter portucalensis]